MITVSNITPICFGQSLADGEERECNTVMTLGDKFHETPGGTLVLRYQCRNCGNQLEIRVEKEDN